MAEEQQASEPIQWLLMQIDADAVYLIRTPNSAKLSFPKADIAWLLWQDICPAKRSLARVAPEPI
jgi:hypothetical protein